MATTAKNEAIADAEAKDAVVLESAKEFIYVKNNIVNNLRKENNHESII